MSKGKLYPEESNGPNNVTLQHYKVNLLKTSLLLLNLFLFTHFSTCILYITTHTMQTITHKVHPPAAQGGSRNDSEWQEH